MSEQFVFVFDIDENTNITLSLFNGFNDEMCHLRILLYDNKNGTVTFLHDYVNNKECELHKNLKKYLDQSDKPRFLPRFKYNNIHLDRNKSRELYDFLCENSKPRNVKREENIDDLLKN
jgi:hypothetical protein